MRSSARPLFAALSLALWPSAVFGQVTVEQKPAVVERKTFDPVHRPAEMPELKSGEAAVTESQFDCAAELTYKVIERKPGDSSCSVSLRVQAVHLTLSTKIVMWLPGSAPAKLTAHEEGHRQIDQRVYDQAVSDAQQRARSLQGQTLHASATDCTAAERKATQTAADELCSQFLKEIGSRAGRINDAYDKITGHGVKVSPAESEAIAQAFECEAMLGKQPAAASGQ